MPAIIIIIIIVTNIILRNNIQTNLPLSIATKIHYNERPL